VDRIVLQVSGPGMTTIQTTIDSSAGQATITVPDGSSRKFEVWAYPANSSTPNYYGTTTVNVSGNMSITIQMSSDVPSGSEPDRAWQGAELIETIQDEGSSNPRVALDSTGNAIAVWQQLYGGVKNIFSNRYSSNPGWSSHTNIQVQDQGQGALPPNVAIDSNGNAIAVWVQNSDVRSNFYTVGSGWDATLKNGGSSGGVSSSNPLPIGFDPGGNAFIAWYEPGVIKANRYTPGSAWQTVVPISSTLSGNTGVDLAVSVNGSAIAIWDNIAASFFIQWNRYDSGWQGVDDINSTSYSGSTSGPKIAIDTSGNAMAVWDRDNSSNYYIYASRYVSGSSFTTDTLYSGTTSAAKPHVAVDGSGNAVAVWISGSTDVKAKRYTGTWDTNATTIDNSSGSVDDPKVAMDNDGNAIAVWKQNDDIWAAQYVIGSGWQQPLVIDNDGEGGYPAKEPHVAVNSSGDGIAVWVQQGSLLHVYANRFFKP
jgi:hypothetical protein